MKCVMGLGKPLLVEGSGGSGKNTSECVCVSV